MTSTLNLTIKSTSGDKFPVSADASSTIAQLKAIIQKLQDIPSDQQRLIFKGHVLKDEMTLVEYSIGEGHTIILVKGTKKPAEKAASPKLSASEAKADSSSAARPTSTPTPAAAGTPAGPTPAANPFAAMMGNPLAGAASGGSMQDMQRQLLENPEMMRSVMDSPMMQSLLDNPELMQTIIQGNPQMRALMERNPEMAHILNDPAIIRQSMEIARNPELMREMMRNTDRAMSNIEAHPEGFNALRRMYENIQEPMMDASSGSGNSSGSATVVNPDDPNAAPDSNPIPNPWAPASASSSGGANSSASAAAANPFGGADLSSLGALGGLGSLGGMGANPANMNPDQMLEMLDNPFVQQMMRSMMSNPETMEQMISSNPMARQMMEANPQMRDMFRDPTFVQMMSDPQTLRSMIQMQRMFGGAGAGVGAAPAAASGSPSSGSAAAPAVNPFSLFGNFPAAAPASSGSSSSSSGAANPYAALFAGGSSGLGAAANSEVRPEIIYRDQLAQLNSMGFTEYEANINALIQTGGDLQAAINRLLGM